MIVKILMDMLKALILLVINLFPTLPDMSSLLANIKPVFDAISMIDSFISIRILSTCIGLIFVFTNAEFIWSVVMWVVKKIPGVS